MTFSPNVVSREFDFSDYAIRSSTTILGIVGYATKGPTHQVVRISNERELIDTFGLPQYETSGTGYVSKNLIMPAIIYLRQGNQLLVVRADSNTSTGSVVLVDEESNTVLTVSAISPGSWATTQGLSVKVSDGSAGTGYYKLEVITGGVVREKYDNLTTYDNDPTNWASARINDTSFYITCTEASSLNGIVPVSGSALPLTGGTESGSKTESDFTTSGKGLSLFADKQLINVNLLACPGASRETSDSLQNISRAAITLCENRGDCTYLMDPVYSAVTVQSLRDSVNGGSGYGAAFDSSYGSIAAHWIATYDSYNQKTVFTPPSTWVAGQCAYTARVAQPWFASAGLNRGKLKLASGVKVQFTSDDLEVLQAPREIINPIRNMVGEGVVIWGVRTMQRKSSALDRLPVRIMLNYAKSTIEKAVAVLLFEQNDASTWRRFSQLVTPVIQNIKDTRGVYDFRVICDASTNPPALIDSNQMQGKILLKPTKLAEIITVDFSILNTGASFNEFV